MILVRRNPDEPAEELDLLEFERRAKNGEVAPQHQVCFPAVTGEKFVAARDLELYRGLYASGLITFRRYFHLARMPWMTLLLIGVLCLTYFVWQGGAPGGKDELVQHGAKSSVLMFELGQWWRLLTANFLHVSGWHLAANAIFLFNLGGPTEAVFRRQDYALIVAASLLGTTLLSAAANPLVSCGASGLVFGVWGAAAVFGMRHRKILPDRYRRYFIGSVIPYSLFALYIGFAIDGIDNWGHLGGLLAGSVTASFLPARLLVPKDRLLPAKLLGLSACALAIAAASLLPQGVGTLTFNRYYPRGGLSVPLPAKWQELNTQRDARTETYACGNGAGVMVGIRSRLEQLPVPEESLGRDFVSRDLAAYLETSDIQGLKIGEPVASEIGGCRAAVVVAELLTEDLVSQATYVVIARGYYHYVVSFTVPRWLSPYYEEAFANIIGKMEISEPDELAVAVERAHSEDTPFRHAQLAVAHAHAGDLEMGLATLRAAELRWPTNLDLPTVRDRLWFEAGKLTNAAGKKPDDGEVAPEDAPNHDGATSGEANP